MKKPFPHSTKTLLLVAVFVTAAAASLCNQVAAQDLDVKITVDGTPVITSQPAVRQGNEWLVPLLAIARALSVDVQTASEPDTIKLRRANGVEYTFNARTGEIRNRYLLIGRITPNPAQLRGLNDELMFPLSGIVALFGVSVEEDADRNTIVIESNRDGSGGGSIDAGGSTPAFQMIGMNYSYGLTTNGKQFGQIASLEGQGLLGGVKLRGSLETTRIPGRSLLGIAQTSLRAELRPDRVFLLGDQSTYSGLDALTVSVRGIGYESRLDGFSSYYYGGRGRGSTSAVLGSSGINKYDTTIGGFALRRRNPQWEVDFAGNTFLGPTRNGITMGAALSSTKKRNQFKAQTMLGSFSGVSVNRPVDGRAYGLVIADTFTPTPMLSLTAQTEHYSKNFLTARDDARFSGQTNSALGLAFRPIPSISFTGGVVDRVTVGAAGRSRGYNYGTQYALGGNSPVLFGYFRNVIKDTVSPIRGKFNMTQYSVNIPRMNSYSFSTYYSEIHNGPSQVRDLALFATKNTRLGQLGLHDQLQLGQTHRYGLDWLMNLGPRDSHIQFGADHVGSISGKRTISPKVSLRIPFFGGHSLQLRYTGEPDNHIFQVEVSGPVIRRREMELSNGNDNLVVRPSDLKGRVYFDTNNDGHYEESVDQPVAFLTLWLDDTAKVVTDARGTFRFDQVIPGAYRLRADLSGLPADLAMADNVERTVAVAPYRENVQNFRVLRMGRIIGKVTYLDYSEDAENPVERSLPDARITVGSNLDTYTETNGFFIAGDLVPGEYKLMVDPSTIPEGYVSKPESITIAAKPGQTDESVRFLISRAPRPVIERKLPAQEVGLR